MVKNRFIGTVLFIALVSANAKAQDDKILESLAKRPGLVVFVIGAVAATAVWFFTRPLSTTSRENPADVCERLREENAKLKRFNDAINTQVANLESRIKYLLQMHREEKEVAHTKIESLEEEIERLNAMLERTRRKLQSPPRGLSPSWSEVDCTAESERTKRNAGEELEVLLDGSGNDALGLQIARADGGGSF